jgi:hypothetical protein
LLGPRNSGGMKERKKGMDTAPPVFMDNLQT